MHVTGKLRNQLIVNSNTLLQDANSDVALIARTQARNVPAGSGVDGWKLEEMIAD
jgi:hypothetical protein